MGLGGLCSSTLVRCVRERLPRARRASLFVLPLAVAAPALFLTCGVAQAADTPNEEPGAENISEVIVTATRREEKAKDVPVSTSALSGDALQVLGDSGQDIRQLAFRVPSLNIETSNGRAFPRFYIRGYGNTDFHDFASQPVGLYYDDIVQENAALKGFPVFDQADVEVLRGPQGTLFGRNSPAGVVKLESAKPQLGQSSGSLSVSDGTFNSAVLEAYTNVPINDTIAARLSVQAQHRDNWVSDPINLTKAGGYNDWAGRLQVLLKPNDDLTVLFNVHGRSLDGSSTLFRANIIQPGSNKLIAGFDPARFYADGPNSASLGTLGANIHVTYKLPLLTLQSITGYETVQNYLAEGDIDAGYGPGFFSGSPLPSGPGAIPFPVQTSAGLLHHEQWTQEFRALTNYDGPLQAQGGVFLFYEDVIAADNDYCTPGVPPLPVPCQNQEQLWTLQDTTVSRQRNDAEAVFGSIEYTPIEAFKGRAGLRFTEDHKTFATLFNDTVPPVSPPLTGSSRNGNVSWDVSGTYSVTSDINVYARIATGFRAPSFGEPAAGIPIQEARSEKNISYETGVKGDVLEHRASFAFDVYYYHVKNQQLTAVGGNANVTQLVNARDTYGKGAEIELEAHPLTNLTLNFSGSFNYTKIDDPTLTTAVCFSCTVTNAIAPNGNAYISGNPLPQAARWVGIWSARYDYPLTDSSKLYVYTDWSSRSRMNLFLYTSKEFVVQPLTEGGLRLGYTWEDGKYDFAAFCRNCTNQIRVIGGIDFDNLTGFINDPRVFGAQFRMKF
jgi:iron complex outermembrane recepter protein